MENLFSRLRGARHMGLAAVAALVAVCLLLLGGESENAGSDLETRIARALSAMEGAGRLRVLLNERQAATPAFSQQEAGGVVGVVILAEGADDAAVRLALSGAAQTLLGVDAAQVEVLKLEAG